MMGATRCTWCQFSPCYSNCFRRLPRCRASVRARPRGPAKLRHPRWVTRHSASKAAHALQRGRAQLREVSSLDCSRGFVLRVCGANLQRAPFGHLPPRVRDHLPWLTHRLVASAVPGVAPAEGCGRCALCDRWRQVPLGAGRGEGRGRAVTEAVSLQLLECLSQSLAAALDAFFCNTILALLVPVGSLGAFWGAQRTTCSLQHRSPNCDESRLARIHPSRN